MKHRYQKLCSATLSLLSDTSLIVTAVSFASLSSNSITHVADIHDVKLIELNSVALKLEWRSSIFFGAFYTYGIGSER